MQNPRKTTQSQQLEKLQLQERTARANANALRWDYIAETNTRVATWILKQWDQAMKISHDLMNDQHYLLFGKKLFTHDRVISEPVKKKAPAKNFLSVTFGNYARN